MKERRSIKCDAWSTVWEHSGNNPSGLWHLELNWYRLPLIYHQISNEKQLAHTLHLSLLFYQASSPEVTCMPSWTLWRHTFKIWNFKWFVIYVHLVHRNSSSILLCEGWPRVQNHHNASEAFHVMLLALSLAPGRCWTMCTYSFALETHRLSRSGLQSWPTLWDFHMTARVTCYRKEKHSAINSVR